MYTSTLFLQSAILREDQWIKKGVWNLRKNTLIKTDNQGIVRVKRREIEYPNTCGAKIAMKQ